jgi:hypothetical protein
MWGEQPVVFGRQRGQQSVVHLNDQPLPGRIKTSPFGLVATYRYELIFDVDDSTITVLVLRIFYYILNIPDVC